MNSDGLEIRPFRDGDEAELVRLLDSHRDGERALDEWAWRYPASPRGRPIVVATRRGCLVGWLGAVVRRFRVDGATLEAAAVVDVSAPGEQEGRPPRPDVLELLARGFEREFGPGRRFELIYDVANGDREEATLAAVPGLSTAIVEFHRLIRRDAPRKSLRRLAYRAEPARDWEPRLDGLWQRAEADYPVAILRDADFALERHAGHPTRRGHRFVIMPRFSRAAVAWVVFERRDTACWWTDLVWDHDYPGALDLAAHLSGRLAGQMGAGLEVIDTGGDGRLLRRLQELGFTSETAERGARVTVLASAREQWTAAVRRGMYLTSADLESAHVRR